MKMNPDNTQEFSDTSLTRLLERAPQVPVPADFAARVCSALPKSLPSPRPASAAQPVAMVFAVLIAAALFAMAPHARASVESVAFWIELVLLMELGGIAYWLTVKREVL